MTDLELLQDEVRLLRERLSHFLSRKGGFVDGNIAYSGVLKSEKDSVQYTGYTFVPLATPLTSSNWNSTSKEVGHTGIIDMSDDFSLPSDTKAIAAHLRIADETEQVEASLGPNSSYQAIRAITNTSLVFASSSGICPCDSNGDVYFYCSSELDSVTIYIFGYFI